MYIYDFMSSYNEISLATILPSERKANILVFANGPTMCPFCLQRVPSILMTKTAGDDAPSNLSRGKILRRRPVIQTNDIFGYCIPFWYRPTLLAANDLSL